MNIEIYNSSKKPIRRAGIVFGPGKTSHKQASLTASQIAQIRADEALSVSFSASSSNNKGDK